MSNFDYGDETTSYGEVKPFKPRDGGSPQRNPAMTRPSGQQDSVVTSLRKRVTNSVAVKEPEKGLIEEIFASSSMDELNEVMDDSSYSRPDTDTSLKVIKRYIDGKREELAYGLDHPSWGPKFSPKSHKRSRSNPVTRTFSKGRSRDEDVLEPVQRMDKQDQMIAANLEQSHRYSRYSGLYIGSAIVSFCIVLAALVVDYSIIKQFWHQAMVNEYMQLPPELAQSVTFKSLQVLFATIGIHLVLRHLPRWAIAGFTGVVFLLTMAMMLSLGFLYAHNSLPNDSQATIEGRDTNSSGLGDMLSTMGLQPETATAAAETAPVELPAWMEQLAVYDALGWMISLSVIFLIVASVGALFLLWSEHNVRNWTIAKEYRTRSYHTTRLRRAESMALQLSS